MKKENLLETLKNLKIELIQQFPIQRMALFGSYARNEQTSDSDIDILIDIDPKIGLGFVKLAELLEQRLGKKVDLVSWRAVQPNRWEHLKMELIDI